MTAANDPAGFLQLAPRLVELMSDDEVRTSVHVGDGHRLHAALKAKLKSPQEHERTLATQLLGVRRLFVSPVKKAPGLSTVNGVGTGLRFSSDKSAQDGSYVATLCILFVFLPVFPLGQYLVRYEGDRRYVFLGKLPPSPLVQMWRRVMSLFFAACVALAGFGVWESGQHSQVWVVNGFDFPVVMELGAQKISVAAQGRAGVDMPVGPAHVRAVRQGGAPLQELDVEVPRWTDAVVVNVLGAAPLYVETVEYSTKGDAPDGQFRVVAGEPFFVQDHVQDVFRDPPKEVRTKSSRVTRWHLGLGEGGVSTTVRYLLSQDRLSDAMSLLRGILMAIPDEPPQEIVDELRTRSTPADWQKFVKQWSDAYPLAPGANRALQDQMFLDEEEEAARKLYEERFKAHPDSPAAGSLYARVLPDDRAVALYKELLARFPDDAGVNEAHLGRLWNIGRYDDATKAADALHKLSPAKWLDNVAIYARSASASGHAAEALRTIAAAASAEAHPGIMEVMLYWQLVASTGEKNPPVAPEKLAAKLARATDPAWASLMAVGTASDDTMARIEDMKEKRAALITAAAWTSADDMMARAHGADAKVMEYIPRETLVLMTQEAMRRGDDDLVQAVLDSGVFPVDFEAFEFYLQEGDEALIGDMEPLYRSAIHFGRARLLKGAARDALVKRALAEDLLPTNVTAAIKRWKKP